MTDSLNSLKGVCKAWSNIRPRTSEMSGCFLSIWSFHMRDVSKKVSSRHITLKLAAARLHAWQRGSWWINLQLSLKKERGFAWRSWIKYFKHLVLTRKGKKNTRVRIFLKKSRARFPPVLDFFWKYAHMPGVWVNKINWEFSNILLLVFLWRVTFRYLVCCG